MGLACALGGGLFVRRCFFSDPTFIDTTLCVFCRFISLPSLANLSLCSSSLREATPQSSSSRSLVAFSQLVEFILGLMLRLLASFPAALSSSSLRTVLLLPRLRLETTSASFRSLGWLSTGGWSPKSTAGAAGSLSFFLFFLTLSLAGGCLAVSSAGSGVAGCLRRADAFGFVPLGRSGCGANVPPSAEAQAPPSSQAGGGGRRLGEGE